MTRRILESGWGLVFLLGCTSEVTDPPGIGLGGGAGDSGSAMKSGMGGAGGAGPAVTTGGASVSGASGGSLATSGSGGANASGGMIMTPSSGGNSAGGTAGMSGKGGTANAGAGGQVCAQAEQISCSGFCVNPTNNPSHCGGCNKACATGVSCIAGVCGGCSTEQGMCSGKCVDVKTDAKNCGTCGNVCSGACVNGQCSCATPQTLCGNSCVDLQVDPANCGVCGTSCGIGRACSAGQCVESKGGAAGPDGCVGLAQNVTLSSVFVYQTVEVPLMKAGTEVAVSARKTDVIAGRDAMFRLFVTVGSGWAARELSGRVFVDNGGTVDVYSSKKSISQSSQAGTLDSTLQVTVPKDKITANTKYQVELVECGTGSGALQTPRFPADAAIALGARQAGVLKIKIIPLKANNMVPDTSETGLNAYKSLILAMYPITNVELTVGTALTVADARDWNGMLDQVRAQRNTEKPAAEFYYYGMLKPTATFREYCGSACTAGIGFVPQGSGSQQAGQRASLGLAFGDVTSAETMAHEVGHNHGLSHAPCVRGGSISGVDPSYPQSDGKTGVYGWDSRSMTLLPPTRTDIMGYCDNQWISDYNYDRLLTRVASLNGAAPLEVVSPELERPWRVVLLDDRGLRWGIPIAEPSAPSGEAEPAEVLDARGNVLEIVEVYRTEVSDIDAFSLQVPEPEPGWVSIRIAGNPPLAYAP